MLLLEGLSVSFFNFLLTLRDMPGILEGICAAFHLVTELFGERICILEISRAASKRKKNLCIIHETIESPFLYTLLHRLLECFTVHG